MGGTHLCGWCFNRVNGAHRPPVGLACFIQGPRVSFKVSACLRADPPWSCPLLWLPGFLWDALPRNGYPGRAAKMSGWPGARQPHPLHGFSSVSPKAFGEEMLFLQNVPSHQPQKPAGQKVQEASLGVRRPVSPHAAHRLSFGARHGERGRALAASFGLWLELHADSLPFFPFLSDAYCLTRQALREDAAQPAWWLCFTESPLQSTGSGCFENRASDHVVV